MARLQKVCTCCLSAIPYVANAVHMQLIDPEISKYRDRRFEGNQNDFERALQESTTVYVGNLSFFTTEEQIYEVLSNTGYETQSQQT